jgi:hypothetical protein
VDPGSGEENRHMKRRGDVLDSRINQTAIDLYKLGRKMLREGVSPSSEAFIDVAFGLNRALKLRPWDEILLDAVAYEIEPAKLETEKWRVQLELLRQLEALV